MKRLFLIAAFAFIATLNIVAQSIETPICYALKEHKGTLKYHFTYEDSKYFTCFRLYENSGNTLKAGDKIIMENENGEKIEFAFTEQIIQKAGEKEYYPVETDYRDLLCLETTLKRIRLVRDGTSEDLELTGYCKSCTKKGAIAMLSAFEKENNAILTDVPMFHRAYVGYAPTQSKGYVHYEGLTFGYIGGLRLGKESMNYFEFGVQFDYIHGEKFDGEHYYEDLTKKTIRSAEDVPNPYSYTTDLNNFSISIPLAFTHRFELGHSGAMLSPYIGPMAKFNVQEKGADVFQIGAQGGINFDYKHLYLGMGYHIEFEIKGSDHTRGLFFRIGATF